MTLSQYETSRYFLCLWLTIVVQDDEKCLRIVKPLGRFLFNVELISNCPQNQIPALLLLGILSSYCMDRNIVRRKLMFNTQVASWLEFEKGIWILLEQIIKFMYYNDDFDTIEDMSAMLSSLNRVYKTSGFNCKWIYHKMAMMWMNYNYSSKLRHV